MSISSSKAIRAYIAALSIVVLVSLSCHAPQAFAKPAPPQCPELRLELISMAERDQATRDVPLSGAQARASMMRQDAQNLERLKQIVERHGWPTADMVGRDGAQAAWLLAQHADTDRAFQKKVLQLMEPLTRTDQASPKSYAYLYDRVHLPQRYGTQGRCVTTGKHGWRPFDIEDVEQVNARRRQIGLNSMAEYAASFECTEGGGNTAAGVPKTVPVPAD